MISLPDKTQVPALETDQFRIVVPKLCERSVKQYSGYFNIAKDKHMFFWWVTKAVRGVYCGVSDRVCFVEVL